MRDMDTSYLVTGGGGYFGHRLALSLLKTGANVFLFDINEPLSEVGRPENLNFIKGDVSNFEDVKQACKGKNCVFHVASYGMSGREQLNRPLIEAVNVKGTQNIIEACRLYGVTSLVYTSTTNVVFYGQSIHNGNENLPYVPDEKHVDHYSRTKCAAEKLIIQANGTKGADGSVLRTCAIRPAGIYGEGERRHLPRIVGYIERGLFTFTYGADDSLVEFVHVDNLVQAHQLAAKALQRENSVAGGQAYFISDGSPVNNFEFFRPLIEGLGYTYPRFKLPIQIIYFFAFLTEMIHAVVGRYVYNFQPLLTRAEVLKTGVTHYFSLDKAKKELGYEPKVHDFQGVVKYFKQRGCERRKTRSFFLVNIALGLIAVLVIFSFLPIAK